MAAVIAAFTRLDEHGRPLETLSIRADEGHRHRARATWRTASSICTYAAVVGPVQPDARAVSVGQTNGLWGFLGWGALPPFLGGSCQDVARSYGADSRLPLQLALRVVIGDTGRNAHPTATRALGPFSGLDGTFLVLQVVPHREVFVAVFTLPAAGLDLYKLIDQRIFRLLRNRMVLRAGQVLLRWRHLMLRRKPPGVLMAIHAEAALAGYPDQPWVGAGWRGWGQLVVTEGSAANSTVDAGTLVFTPGTKTLPVLKHPAVVFTCASF